MYSLFLPAIVSAVAAIIIQPADAQILQNGQVFTSGLAIFDSPAPNSILHAGSSMNIAVDVSGDGKLSQPSFKTAGFDSLNIFLVSSETNLNLTITSGPSFLLQEAGSTVKHLTWDIPQCVQPGAYNVTIYEAAHLGNANFYSITPIPVNIQNNAPSGSCSSTNQLFADPQSSSPPPGNPFLDQGVLAQFIGSPSSSSSSSGRSAAPPQTLMIPPASASASPATSQTAATVSPSTLGAVTVTLGPQGVQWPLTIAPPQETVPMVVEPSDYYPAGTFTVTASLDNPGSSALPGADDGTVTVVITPSATPTPVTVVFVSMATETVTTTVAGEASVFTTTEVSFSTTMAFMAMASALNTDRPDYSGFLPINAVSFGTRSHAFVDMFTLVWMSGFMLLVLL